MSLWDLYQHAQIRGMRASQHMADRESLIRDHRQERRVDEIDERLEQLGTLVEALWSLCRDRLSLSDAELVAAVQAVAERERAAAAAGPTRCTGCGAAVVAELDKCQFCGAPSPRESTPFDGL